MLKFMESQWGIFSNDIHIGKRCWVWHFRFGKQNKIVANVGWVKIQQNHKIHLFWGLQPTPTFQTASNAV